MVAGSIKVDYGLLWYNFSEDVHNIILLIPASNFLLLASWCLSHSRFPVFWALIHCHSLELSFPLAVGSELLYLTIEH